MRRWRPLLALAAVVGLVLSPVGGFLALDTVAAGNTGGNTASPGADGVLTVDDSGGAEFTTIQGAVDAAAPGDTVQVASGTYEEQVVIDKPVTVVGDPGGSGPGAASDAPTLVNETHPALLVKSGAGGTTVRGMRIDNWLKTTGVDGFTLRNSTVPGNEGTLRVESSSGVTFADNDLTGFVWVSGPTSGFDFRRNRLSGGSENLYFEPCSGCGGTVVSDIDIRNNTGGFFLDTYSGDWRNVQIADNELSGTYWAPVNADGMTVADNSLDNSFDFQIIDQGVWQDVRIANNDIGTGALNLFFDTGRRFEDVAIVGNRVQNAASAIALFADGCYGTCGKYESPTTMRNVTIARNDVRGAGQIAVFASETTVNELQVAENRVGDVSGMNGIALYLSGADVGTATVRDNEIRDIGLTVDRDFGVNYDTGGGVYLGVGDSDSGRATADAITVSGNRIANLSVGTGVRVTGNAESANVTVTDNVVTDLKRPSEVGKLTQEDVNRIDATANGVKLSGASNVDLDVRGNVFDRSQYGVLLKNPGKSLDVDVDRNQFSKLGNAVVLNGSGTPAGVSINRNNLVEVRGYGVENELRDAVDARNNYWGASDGPSNATSDPLFGPSGAAVNGSGAAVTEDPVDDKLSNVRFDPFATSPIDLDAPSTEPEPPKPPETPGTPSAPVDPPEPEFEYEGTVSPTVIDPGNTTWVNVTVTNVGDAAGRYDGQLSTGFVDLASRPGKLAPGESRRLRFEVAFDEVSINQLFVDGDYVGDVRVRQPSPAELTRRHLEVESAYLTRWAVSAGDSYETVAVLENTDDEAHEFEVTFDTLRTTGPGTKTRTHVANRTMVLEAGEQRVVRHEATVERGVTEPRGARAFVAGVPAGNLTVLPPDAGAHGLTHAYTTPHATTPGNAYETVLVFQNANGTAETFTRTLVRADRQAGGGDTGSVTVRVETVTVEPGGTAVVRTGAAADATLWRLDDRLVPLLGEPEED